MINLINGDCLEELKKLPAESVHCVITSPPYFMLRDYNVEGQIGLEKSPQEYILKLTAVFREVYRVLRYDGTLWLNLGDSYAGGGRGGNSSFITGEGKDTSIIQSKRNVKRWDFGNIPSSAQIKPKDLIGIPWRVALALQADGWYLRSDIIWNKLNPMPESVLDRPTRSHEYIFLLTKSSRYFYDGEAIKEPSIYPDDNRKARVKEDQKRVPTDRIAGVRSGSKTYPTRNRRSVWDIATQSTSIAHFATFPEKLVEPCILAGTSKHGCCPVCGKPWVRKTQKQAHYKNRQERGQPEGSQPQVDSSGWLPATVTDHGFQPSCDHNAAPIPCVVMDPFSGAGTTLLVADRLGRSAIGIELNPEYVQLSKERITNDCPLFVSFGAFPSEVAHEVC